MYINDLFKATPQFTPRCAVVNSMDPVTRLREEKTSVGNELISFDVSGLFPNTPLEPTISYMKRLIRDANVPQSVSDDLFGLVNNFCQFKGKIYKFPEDVGVPIGSPLRSLMGDLFMDLLESEVLNGGNPLTGRI